MQFARDNPEVNVVGVGAGTAVNGDTLDGAIQFANRFGTADAGVTMLYDVSFRSWRNFGITTQPWVVLFDRQGQVVYNQAGRVDLTGAASLLGV